VKSWLGSFTCPPPGAPKVFLAEFIIGILSLPQPLGSSLSRLFYHIGDISSERTPTPPARQYFPRRVPNLLIDSQKCLALYILSCLVAATAAYIHILYSNSGVLRVLRIFYRSTRSIIYGTCHDRMILKFLCEPRTKWGEKRRLHHGVFLLKFLTLVGGTLLYEERFIGWNRKSSVVAFVGSTCSAICKSAPLLPTGGRSQSVRFCIRKNEFVGIRL
jgi:hypothetical protein